MLDELFDDPIKFIKYMQENNNEATKTKLLKTDRLRMLYCEYVEGDVLVAKCIKDSRYISPCIALLRNGGSGHAYCERFTVQRHP